MVDNDAGSISESKPFEKPEIPIPPQCLMFNPNSSRYRCCRGNSHVRTGALIVGSIEIVGFVLLLIIAVGDRLSYNTPILTMISLIGIVCVRLPATVLMLTVVYYQYPSGRLIIPELVVQSVTAAVSVIWTLYLLVRFVGLWTGLMVDKTEEGWVLERTIGMSTIATYLVLLIAFSTIQIWFLRIIHRCYNYLLDKKFQAEYWSEPVYV